MQECNYCDETIATEDSDNEQPYLTHLADNHANEISRIDEKRLKDHWDGDLEEARSKDYRFSAEAIGAATGLFIMFLGFVWIGYNSFFIGFVLPMIL